MRERFTLKFWFGFIAGTGFGVLLLNGLVENWETIRRLPHVSGRIIAWPILVAGFILAAFVGRPKKRAG